MAAANWYAIRLKPGAYRPSRMDTRVSNIEHALSSSGVNFYAPIEKRPVIHHRTKQLLDKRFPLIPGYAFVTQIEDWGRFVKKTDFVAGVLGRGLEPVAFSDGEIEIVRQSEKHKLEEYERFKANRLHREREAEERKKHIPQRRARQMFPAGSPIVIDRTHVLLGGMKGRVVDATGRQTIKAIIETLNGMVNAELSMAFVSPGIDTDSMLIAG